MSKVLTAAPAAAPSKGLAVTYTGGYRWYVLGLLTVVFSFSHMDRTIIAILLNSIAIDLKLTDWEAGAISGLAFTITYITLGVPLAWAADRGKRKRIISASLALWSLMTALCGATHNMWQMFLARMGVGIGEAGCVPASQSIIADYFPRERRAFALAIFGLGIPIGSLAGYALGGIINDAYGWRAALFIVGAPGLLVAIVLQRTLREPPRGFSDRHDALPDEPLPTFGEVVRFIVNRWSLLHLFAGTSLIVFGGAVSQTWIPAFFERSHGLRSSQIGVWLAPSIVLGGGIGVLLGGWLADKLAKRDPRWYVWIPGIAMIPAVPIAALVLLLPATIYQIVGIPVHSYVISIALMAIPGAAYTCYVGPVNAVIQLIVGLRMRATAIAVFLMITNLVGMGLGPFLVGMVSDFMVSRFGHESLRYSMLVFLFIYVWAAFHFFRAGKYLREDLGAQYR